MLKSELRERYRFEDIVGNSTAMQDVYDLMERVVPTETTVLITGGTGKELVARALREGTATVGAGQTYAHLSLQEAREIFEQSYIVEVLTKTGGNITHASKMAGIAWQNFHQKLKKYGIDAKSFRSA